MPTPKKAAAAKNALSKPVQPDAALTAVVGKDPLPRTELTKKLWEYIRKHELQDPKNKRNIRAAAFGAQNISRARIVVGWTPAFFNSRPAPFYFELPCPN